MLNCVPRKSYKAFCDVVLKAVGENVDAIFATGSSALIKEKTLVVVLLKDTIFPEWSLYITDYQSMVKRANETFEIPF